MTKLRMFASMAACAAFTCYWMQATCAKAPSSAHTCNPDPKKSVVYIYNRELDELPAATGFIMGFHGSSKGKLRDIPFLITNKHVLTGQKILFLRFPQDIGSTAHWMPLSLDTGHITMSPKSEVDLVAVELQNVPPDWYEMLEPSCMIGERRWKASIIGEGCDVFTVSWITQTRKEYKIPGLVGPRELLSVLRFGKISLLTLTPWLTERSTELREQAYVVDMQSTPVWGSSGSPLFVAQDHHLHKEKNSKDNSLILIGVNKGFMSSDVNVEYTNVDLTKTLKNIYAAQVNVPDELILTEPATNLRALMQDIKKNLTKSGHKIELN